MTVDLSVVVVAYDMARELPRTLTSLSTSCQTDIRATNYEVVVVDNGSPDPVDPGEFRHLGDNFRFHRLDPAPRSPVQAANTGIGLARGPAVGLIIDGARIASPGLLSAALGGLRLVPNPVVTSLAWHIGPARQTDADGGLELQDDEDALLDEIDWPNAGYRLFQISTLADSSSRGWFGPIGESSALFMPATLWRDLGGLDPAFTLPGGGLVNHDLFRRSLESHGTNLVVLLGEGTFHQTHGGAATSGRFTWDEMQADYECIRGTRFTRPEQDPVYVGRIPPEARTHLLASLDARADGNTSSHPKRRRWTLGAR